MSRPVYALWAASLLLGAVAVWKFQPSEPNQAVATTGATAGVTTPDVEGDGVADYARDEPIQPLPRVRDVDQRQARLGRRLFHDPRLSRGGAISCATCHDLTKGGADGMVRSRGHDGAEGTVNTPTVFNSRFNFKQFWDGRAETLEEQVDGPITNVVEMAADWPTIVATLGSDPSYDAAFRDAYADGVTPANVRKAIASFESSLTTPDSRFDRYLRGDRTAITDEEKRGYELFKDLGCTTCHQGVNVGGNMFQTMGRMGDYFADRGHLTDADLGRYNVTKQARDRFKFKVPSLRNVTLTAPYLHDGQAKTLERAVAIMARYQLGHDLAPAESHLLVAFLATLTGEYRDGS